MGLISRVSSRTYRNQKSKNPTHTMIIPTDDRLKIWRTLFQEGVMVAAKDTRSTHADTKVRNLFVMKALQSLKSKGFVKENYTWQHYHWALTDDQTRSAKDDQSMETETATDEIRTVETRPLKPALATKPSNTKVDTAEENQLTWNKFNNLLNLVFR